MDEQAYFLKRSNRGYVTEERFVLAAIERDLMVSRPCLPNYPFDFVVTTPKGCMTAQVKSSHAMPNGSYRCDLRSTSGRKHKDQPCIDPSVAFMAIYAHDVKGFYIIPSSALSEVSSCIRVSGETPWPIYLNNWTFSNLEDKAALDTEEN